MKILDRLKHLKERIKLEKKLEIHSDILKTTTFLMFSNSSLFLINHVKVGISLIIWVKNLEFLKNQNSIVTLEKLKGNQQILVNKESTQELLITKKYKPANLTQAKKIDNPSIKVSRHPLSSKAVMPIIPWSTSATLYRISKNEKVKIILN